MEASINKLIENASWRKTDYIAPHEYVLVHDEPILALQIKLRIKNEGYTKEFKGRKYRYVDIDEYRYWSMGVVLNRARNE